MARSCPCPCPVSCSRAELSKTEHWNWSAAFACLSISVSMVSSGAFYSPSGHLATWPAALLLATLGSGCAVSQLSRFENAATEFDSQIGMAARTRQDIRGREKRVETERHLAVSAVQLCSLSAQRSICLITANCEETQGSDGTLARYMYESIVIN